MYVIKRNNLYLTYVGIHSDKDNNVMFLLSHKNEQSWSEDITRAKIFRMKNSCEKFDNLLNNPFSNLRNSLVKKLKEEFINDDIRSVNIIINEE